MSPHPHHPQSNKPVRRPTSPALGGHVSLSTRRRTPRTPGKPHLIFLPTCFSYRNTRDLSHSARSASREMVGKHPGFLIHVRKGWGRSFGPGSTEWRPGTPAHEGQETPSGGRGAGLHFGPAVCPWPGSRTHVNKPVCGLHPGIFDPGTAHLSGAAEARKQPPSRPRPGTAGPGG